jgi:hypothetical protein|tara:strand:- start:467 stop:784 length:318 start_codon:yes stop_codon:yes gene_type:complete
MKTWDYLAARRGTTLENFLKDVPDLEAALKKFNARRIIPPPVRVIEEYFSAVRKDEVLPTPTSDVKQTPKRTKRKLSTKQDKKSYDEIIIIDTEHQDGEEGSGAG